MLEAYATGLPLFTLGLGSAGLVATPQTGLNDRVERIDRWFESAYRIAAEWLDDSARWLAACRAARARSGEFGPDYLTTRVRE